MRQHRCVFTSLREIVESYRMAFPERSAINQASFWENTDVKTTAAIRNVIVHKAGVADQEFKDDTAADNRVSAWKVGEQFYIDGNLLQQLLRGLFGFSAKLIRAVDDWIAASFAARSS